MAAESGFTVQRSESSTTIHVIPADEYDDKNLKTLRGVNNLGTGCIGLFAIIVGLVVTGIALQFLAGQRLNDVVALILVFAIFVSVTYFTFMPIYRWDRRRSQGPGYVRKAETFVIDSGTVSFGERSIALQDVLSVEARLPPEYGGGAEMVVYDNSIQGRAAASGFQSGSTYLSRCYALYFRSANHPHPLLSVFGLTMPSARELEEVIRTEINQRKARLS